MFDKIPSLIIYMLIFSISTYSQALEVPPGSKVLIDGIIEDKEWKDGLKTKLKNGQFIKVKHDQDFLYLCIRGDKGGFSSVGIEYNDKITILHSSTRLITAAYKKANDDWILSSSFKALSNAVRNEPVNQEEQLNEFGWYANLVGQGKPEDTEFKISLDNLIEENVRLSVVFFQFRAKAKYAYAPDGLNDSSLNHNLIEGGKEDKLNFYPDIWFILKFK
jgi:hypothetical protein